MTDLQATQSFGEASPDSPISSWASYLVRSLWVIEREPDAYGISYTCHIADSISPNYPPIDLNSPPSAWSVAYNPPGEILIRSENEELLRNVIEENKPVLEQLTGIVSSARRSNSAKFGEVRRSSITIELKPSLGY
jgi:hypothetical protein